jgi:hypothetical protein
LHTQTHTRHVFQHIGANTTAAADLEALQQYTKIFVRAMTCHANDGFVKPPKTKKQDVDQNFYFYQIGKLPHWAHGYPWTQCLLTSARKLIVEIST